MVQVQRACDMCAQRAGAGGEAGHDGTHRAAQGGVDGDRPQVGKPCQSGYQAVRRLRGLDRGIQALGVDAAGETVAALAVQSLHRQVAASLGRGIEGTRTGGRQHEALARHRGADLQLVNVHLAHRHLHR